MDILTLKKSVAELDWSESIRIILTIRQSRRTRKVIPVTQKSKPIISKGLKSLIESIPTEELEALISNLEEETDDGIEND